MNKIQKLIDELIVRRKSHWDDFMSTKISGKNEDVCYAKYSECDFFIQKLTLLLNA